MEKNIKRAVLLGCASLAVIVFVKGCSQEVCDKLCGVSQDSGIYVLEHKAPDQNGDLVSSSHSQAFVQTPSGKLKRFNKSEELDPACFAKEDYLADILRDPNPNNFGEITQINPKDVISSKNPIVAAAGIGHYPSGFPKDYGMTSDPGFKADGNLWAMDLTWNNTSIIFINFDENGRLESRELTEKSQTKSNTVYSDIKKIMQPATGTPINEYKAVQYFLTNLVHKNGVFGRPAPLGNDIEGFEVRNLDGIDTSKTPFYKTFKIQSSNPDPSTIDESKGHVFFYVLLDDHLKFQRKYAATNPYTPSVGQYYSPYIQYPIIPSEAELIINPSKVDVMTVHFYQGGTMTDEMRAGAKCSYPYDIGVIAAGQTGQSGWQLKTPLMIDPEVETEGILP